MAPATIRGALVLLILAAVAPAYGVLLLTTLARFRDARDAEVRASADAARSVGSALESSIDDLLGTELALGVSVAGHGHTLAQIQEELEAVAAEYPAVRALSWATLDGRVAASTDARLAGASVFARQYFQEILRGASTSVSPMVQSLADGAPALVVARAIELPAGTRRGVVIATLDPDLVVRAAPPLPRRALRARRSVRARHERRLRRADVPARRLDGAAPHAAGRVRPREPAARRGDGADPAQPRPGAPRSSRSPSRRSSPPRS
jgi:hypothetical protein